MKASMPEFQHNECVQLIGKIATVALMLVQSPPDIGRFDVAPFSDDIIR